MIRAFMIRGESKEIRAVPIEDVLATIDNVKRRVSLITYNPDRTLATKEALAVAVDALEQLALCVAQQMNAPAKE